MKNLTIIGLVQVQQIVHTFIDIKSDTFKSSVKMHFLCVILQDSVSWKPHMNNVSTKIAKGICKTKLTKNCNCVVLFNVV